MLQLNFLVLATFSCGYKILWLFYRILLVSLVKNLSPLFSVLNIISSLVYSQVWGLTQWYDWALLIFFEYFYKTELLSFRNISKTLCKKENSLLGCLNTCIQMYAVNFPTLLQVCCQKEWSLSSDEMGRDKFCILLYPKERNQSVSRQTP